MRILHEETHTLFPRLDKEHNEVALEMMAALSQERPDLHGYTWTSEVEEFENSPQAILTIKVVDEEKWKRWFWAILLLSIYTAAMLAIFP